MLTVTSPTADPVTGERQGPLSPVSRLPACSSQLHAITYKVLQQSPSERLPPGTLRAGMQEKAGGGGPSGRASWRRSHGEGRQLGLGWEGWPSPLPLSL